MKHTIRMAGIEDQSLAAGKGCSLIRNGRQRYTWPLAYDHTPPTHRSCSWMNHHCKQWWGRSRANARTLVETRAHVYNADERIAPLSASNNPLISISCQIASFNGPLLSIWCKTANNCTRGQVLLTSSLTCRLLIRLVDFTNIVQLTRPRCSLPRRFAPADDTRRVRNVADTSCSAY